MKRWLLVVLSALVSASCKTTGAGTAGYNPYAPVEGEPFRGVQQVDGVKYKDPGRVEKTRAAFNTFRM